MKPLLVIFKPRNIPETDKAYSKIRGISKLWIKYYPQPDAYHLARQFFIKSEYTHFIILPDDLIVTQKDVDTICNYDEAFDSISGWCNHTGTDDINKYSNISWFTPYNPPSQATFESYNWMTIGEIESLLSVVHDDLHVFPNDRTDCIQVGHQGFALTRLSRKIVEKIPFRTSAGCCVDSCLSLDLLKEKMPQYVDLKVRMNHLKIPRTELLVGKEEPVMMFENCRE